MKIATRKLLLQGIPYREVLKVEGGKSKGALPVQYYDAKFDRFYVEMIADSRRIFCYSDNDTITMAPKNISGYISEERFQRCIQIIKKGIINLRDVEKSLPIWEGEETFVF